MQHADFKQVFERQIKMCEEVLIKKATEYQTDTDVLHNFRVAAELQGISLAMALSGMMAKHSVSIYDMCQEPDIFFTQDQWDEKITDHINYLILLRAIVRENQVERSVQAFADKSSGIVPNVQVVYPNKRT
jgi:hypothetical protein